MLSLLERLLGDETADEQVDLESRQRDADEALHDAVEQARFDIEDCGVTGVAVVNQGPDGEPVVVPSARFSLGEDVEDPDMDLVWDLVAEAADTLKTPFEDVFVRHYDIQFTFDDRTSQHDFRASQNSLISGDGDELFEAKECRRVLLTDELVERYVADADFGVLELREAVETADDVDDEIAPVAWGECEDYSRTSNAAMVFAGTSAAAAASASAASCVDAGVAAGAGAAGGGAC
ncbi:hypothetical protein [Salinigranum salinum]|uniref:hypothetical protein n=1 Tax=Salinigranum salinum TaxID=1364937 RepID=UPI001260DE27|nr:hypothetical protein [Salinigranum salinum]